MAEKIIKYEIIKHEIEEQIRKMELKPNQVIPSESELCNQYQVSRITVRKAIDELVQKDLLYRIKGKGCFVRDSARDGLTSIYSFTEAILHQGKTPSKQLLSMEKLSCPKELAASIGLEEKEFVYRIKSIYFADGVPYCVNTSLLPEKLFPRLEYFDFNKNSLYEILRNFYQLSFTKVQQTLNATLGPNEVCELMKIEGPNPLLKINATSFCLHDNKETIFEIYESYILTDILNYYVEKYNK